MGDARRRWLAATRAALASPRVAPAAAVLAMLLALPSLWAGLQTEDFAHRSMSRAAHNLFFNLFGAPAAPAQVARLNHVGQDLGLLPWITAPHWRINFFRPVTSLTQNLDYRLWPNTPVLMHAQTLLWFGLLVFAVGVLYRRVLPAGWVAGAAALLFAVDDAHGPIIGWLANRSALIASLLGVLAVIFHDRWRRHRSKIGAIAAPICLWLALNAGELAVSAVGYLVAYALFIEPRVRPGGRKLVRGVVPLLPIAAALAAWAIPYELMGFGTKGSGLYIDPIAQPLDYAHAVVHRLPVLLFGAFASPINWMPRIAHRIGSDAWMTIVVAFVLAVVFVFMFVAREEPSARFFGAGTLLSALPACTAASADRMLVMIGVGAFGVTALIFRHVLLAASKASRRPGGTEGRTKTERPSAAEAALGGVKRLPRWQFVPSACVAAVCLAFHGLLAPVLLPLRSRGLQSYNRSLRRLEASAFDRKRPFSPVDYLVLVNAPDYYSAETMLALALTAKRQVPFHTLVLYGGHDPITIRRSDARTLVVSTSKGFLHAALDQVYRSKSDAMHPGEQLQLTSVLITVDKVDSKGMPTQVSFRFAAPLENPHLTWKVSHGRRYVPFRPPPIGQSVVVKAHFGLEPP